MLLSPEPSPKFVPQKGTSYKLTRPFWAPVIEHTRLAQGLVGDDSYHIVISLQDSGINFLEGQSIGVLPPGKRADGRPLKPRLYSIASSREGEAGEEKTIALTVKRSVYRDEQSQELNYGLCSDYLCRLKVGQKVPITSPSGRILLLPQDAKTDLILVGTGTGVAPYRGFLKFMAKNGWKGEVQLFLGYKNDQEALYCNATNRELVNLCQEHKFKLSLALSRKEQNSHGGKMYVGDKMAQQQPALSKIIARGNFCVFICGIKGMEDHIAKIFRQIASNLNIEWDSYFKNLKKTGRWNIEVY